MNNCAQLRSSWRRSRCVLALTLLTHALQNLSKAQKALESLQTKSQRDDAELHELRAKFSSAEKELETLSKQGHAACLHVVQTYFVQLRR